MYKKPLHLALAALFAALLLAAPALAQDVKKLAVLPFTYNGPQKYSYFPKAFQASLRSDLEWTGHVMPVGDEATEGMKAPKSKADALSTLKNSGLDYIVSGNIAILDKEATLTLNAYSADGSLWTKSEQLSIDEITPWLDEQSKAIMGDVFMRPGYSTTEKAIKKEDAGSGPVAAPVNANFVPADDQYQAAALNPQFRYEGGTEETGRWRSQTFRFYSTSMVVGDGDGDGKNEVFILHPTGIAAFRYDDGKLRQLDNMELTSSTKYIRLEMADVDKDGIPELIVGSYQSYQRDLTKAPEGWPKSHILSFRDGKFKFLVKDYNQFLGVLRLPPTYTPIMVSQRKGRRHIFDKRINEAYLKGNEVVLGQDIQSPEFGNIYNMIYMPDGMGYKYIVIDDSNRLKVYSQTLERLTSSDQDTYNSSGISLETTDRPVGMGPGSTDDRTAIYNIPFRMVTASLTKKGTYELLVNKDLSFAAQIFERFNYYSQGELHALVWDGVGMNLAWKTRRIKGQVSDVALADINNDGKTQLVVLVNTFPGGMGFTHRKTVVLAYDLNL